VASGTVKVFDEDVCRVGLEGDAIISVDDVAVCDGDLVTSVDIPPICEMSEPSLVWLGCVLASILSLRTISLDGMQVDVVKCDIRALVNKIVPEGRLGLVNVFHKNIFRIVDCPWNRSGITGIVPGYAS
jgi:hypothetical protein